MNTNIPKVKIKQAFPVTYSLKLDHIAMVTDLAERTGKNRSQIVQEAIAHYYDVMDDPIKLPDATQP